MKRFVWGAALLALLAVSTAARATDCYVDQIKYGNKGAYDAYMQIVAKTADHGNWGFPGLHEEYKVASGRTRTLDLADFQNYCKHENYINCYGWMNLKEGEEIWLVVDISLGDNSSCRKDGHKLYYKPGVGKTAHFKSSGTTLNNNRCKAVSNWDDICQ